jgi:hypothetical protein
MKLPRRNLLHLAAGAAALPAMSRIARAQTYPTRPVRLGQIYAFSADFGRESPPSFWRAARNADTRHSSHGLISDFF